MTNYLIKSVLCSGLLLLFYHLFLEKEKMFVFNRFYLLFSIIFALAIPLFSISLNSGQTPHQLHTYTQTDYLKKDHLPASMLTATPTDENPDNRTNHIPLLIYATVASILLLRFAKNLHSVFLQKTGTETIRYKNAKLVLLGSNAVTYTFLNNIFVNKEEFLNGQIQEEILTHEYAHVVQKHTLDVLFSELVQIIFWFNPSVFFFRKAIRLNHEFLADEAALKVASDPGSYKILLLNKILSHTHLSLTSSFHYSITKKRLAMMTKIPAPSLNLRKQTLASLLILGLGFIFCEKIQAQKTEDTPTTQPEKAGIVLKTDRGLPKELMAEFSQTITTHTQYIKGEKRIDEIYKLDAEQKKRLLYLYKLMSPGQQKESGVTIYESPMPVKKIPPADLFEKWKNPQVFGVWLDGKKIDNKELANYKYSDIVETEIYKLYGKGKKRVAYKYQLALTTNDFFDKTYQKRLKDRISVWQRIAMK